MPKPTNKRLSDLREYLIEIGTLDKEAIMSKFKLSEADYEPALRQLREKYPDEFDFEFDDETTPPVTAYKLKGEGAFLKDLEVVSQREGLVVLEVKRPKDLVTVVVRGATVTVDLLRLRELPPTSIQHGVEVRRLIELAELAK